MERNSSPLPPGALVYTINLKPLRLGEDWRVNIIDDDDEHEHENARSYSK